MTTVSSTSSRARRVTFGDAGFDDFHHQWLAPATEHGRVPEQHTDDPEPDDRGDRHERAGRDPEREPGPQCGLGDERRAPHDGDVPEGGPRLGDLPHQVELRGSLAIAARGERPPHVEHHRPGQQQRAEAEQSEQAGDERFADLQEDDVAPEGDGADDPGRDPDQRDDADRLELAVADPLVGDLHHREDRDDHQRDRVGGDVWADEEVGADREEATEDQTGEHHPEPGHHLGGGVGRFALPHALDVGAHRPSPSRTSNLGSGARG